MKCKILTFSIFIFFCSTSYGQLKPLTNIYEVSELNQIKPTYGTYNVIGYLSKIYECPPCLDQDLCKPCMPDHIVISEERSLLAKYALTDKEMIVFVDSTEDLKLNKKYNFLIQILDVKTMNQPLNNAKLIYVERSR